MAAGVISGAPVSSGGVSLPIAQSDVTGLTAALAAKAPSASPTFTGTVTLPSGIVIPSSAVLTTQSPGDNSTKAASTAYADAAVAVEASARSTADALKAPLASPTFTGVPVAPVYSASGLTGATAGGRYCGTTTSGAPASGTFLVGDWVTAQDGTQWHCVTAGSPGTWRQVIAGGAVAAAGLMRPADHGFKFWTFDLADVTSGAGTVLTSGTLAVSRVNTPGAAQACTKVAVDVATAGATLTSGQNLVGVYDPTGAQLALSADRTATWASTGVDNITVASFNTPADSFVWVVILSVGTTPVALARKQGQATSALNFGLTASVNLRAGTNATGRTTLPSPLVLATNANANNHYWAAIG